MHLVQITEFWEWDRVATTCYITSWSSFRQQWNSYTNTFMVGILLKTGSLDNFFVGIPSTVTNKASKGCLKCCQGVFHYTNP